MKMYLLMGWWLVRSGGFRRREATIKRPASGGEIGSYDRGARHAVIPNCSLNLFPEARARSATSCRLSPTYIFFSRHKV